MDKIQFSNFQISEFLTILEEYGNTDDVDDDTCSEMFSELFVYMYTSLDRDQFDKFKELT